MSADNWAICPKCEKIAEKSKEAFKLKVQEAYGKFSEDKYLKLTAKLKEPIKVEDQDTLREDFYIGISNGELHIEYSGSCDKCGFEKKFVKREPIKI